MTLTAKMLIWCKHFNIILENNLKLHKMTTNDLMSLIADTAFRIGAGIIIDKAYIEYHLDQVEDKDIREHSKNVINSLLSAKGL